MYCSDVMLDLKVQIRSNFHGEYACTHKPCQCCRRLALQMFMAELIKTEILLHLPLFAISLPLELGLTGLRSSFTTHWW